MTKTGIMAVLLISLFLFSGCFLGSSRGEGKICFDDDCINVEIAETKEELMRGLQSREELCDNCGMLFIFSYVKKYSFWMKDTFIPLDIIWLDSARRVVHIEENVPPCVKDPCATFTTESQALYVVELNVGKARSLGIKEGDIVEFRRLNRKK